MVHLIEVLIVILPMLLSVAFVTVAERRSMGAMQRRLGPNAVGYYGLLQAFADALKLLLKENINPTQANIFLFLLGPVITLVFSLMAYAVLPVGAGLVAIELDLGLLYVMAVSSISTYGVLLAGWAANSKYAFLGSLRSTAQLLSYELVLTAALLVVVCVTGSLNTGTNVEHQHATWLLIPLLPAFILFYISAIAETNRAPFDLTEAESELVSGFMTEHAATVFVFFFLGEYASMLMLCGLTTLLFGGGYLSPWAITQGLVLGIKVSVLVFGFIWVRASLPRVRFDQLMVMCWTVLLPIVVAFIVLVPCCVIGLDIAPLGIKLL